MQSSIIYFKQNKTCFLLVIGKHSHHYLFPLIFIFFFLGEWGLNLCTIYTSRQCAHPELSPQIKLEKISHLFHIYK